MRELEIGQAYLTYRAPAAEARCPECDTLLAVYIDANVPIHNP